MSLKIYKKMLLVLFFRTAVVSLRFLFQKIGKLLLGILCFVIRRDL